MRIKKIHALLITPLTILLLVFFAFYIRLKNNNPPKAQITELKYEKQVTEEDRQPIKQETNSKYIKIPILMYHHVGTVPTNANSTRTDMTVSPEDFESHVKWLSESGFTSISLADIYLYSIGEKTLPKKPVVFTFDDGYEDVFTNAIPILKKYNFIGSFAIITQWPGQTMGDNIYATWDQIASAKNEGMEIVSHSQNHFDGTNAKFNPEYIYQNLSNSILDIQNHLGFTTQVLIYPYGHYTNTYIKEAKKAGFLIALTVHEGNFVNLSNLMEIPRVRVHGKQNLEKLKEIILK